MSCYHLKVMCQLFALIYTFLYLFFIFLLSCLWCRLRLIQISIYTEPKKKLSQNRTSRWAYSLQKKKKSTPTSNETEISNEINDFFSLYMNFDELIFNHCAITNTNKNC